MYDEDESFETAREFFNFLLGDNIFEPKSVFDVSEKVTNSYIFRGQAQKGWNLLPTAHRDVSATPNPLLFAAA